MLRKFNKLAFSGTQSARAAANWQKEIYTTVDYDPNEPKARFKVFQWPFTVWPIIDMADFQSVASQMVWTVTDQNISFYEKTLKPSKVR